MKEHQKQELKQRLANLSGSERKRLMALATDRRHARTHKDRRTPSIEEVMLDILRDQADTQPPAWVEAVHRTSCTVDGIDLRLPPDASPMAPGDQVRHDGTTVTSVLPRRTELKRRDPLGNRDLIIAANVDVVVIVVSCVTPPLHPRLIDRYLAAIWKGGAEAAIVLNKIDLPTAGELDDDRVRLQPYREMGIPIFEASTVLVDGIEPLRQFLTNKLSAFVGHSGVGKSTLVNAVIPRAAQTTGGVDGRGKGTHTTTGSILLREGDLWLVDTPGVREFGVPFDQPSEVAECFREFPSPCQYPGCVHLHEAGCAVQVAVREGTVSSARYDSYRRLLIDAFPRYGKPPDPSFSCQNCGATILVEGGGTRHRNHCPFCLHSVHLDVRPGDRLAACGGVMDPVAVWVRKGGEWAVIHRCRSCGQLSSNRIAADDNEMLLLSLAVKPLSLPPFPLDRIVMG